MISLNQVNYSISGRSLLEKVTFQISNNQRVGLVGRNGCGKSTLFNVMQGLATIDSGDLEIAKHYKILSIKQEMPSGDLSPLDYLLEQDQERLSLLKELEDCQSADRMGDIYERLIQIDAYTAESRAAIVLKGLGFNDEDQLRPLKTFSGGFRMRIALAAALFQEPDLLLLDEPTNHLDFETTQWLQQFLSKYSKSFLMISHDREFLNATINNVLHLKNGKVSRYTGNFDTFLAVYEQQQANLAAYNARLEEQRAHMQSFVDRFKATASKARQAQSRMKAIQKLKLIPVDKSDPTVAFNFPQPETISPPMLSFEKVSIGYGDKVILHNINATLSPDERIGLVGSNGNGKSTLAKFLAGELEPFGGEVKRHGKLKIAFYKQDQFDNMDMDRTAYNVVSDAMPKANPTQIRSHLGRFGFVKDKADQKIKLLSGGERARLLFSCLTAESPNLLILDEPTNHLDMEMRESLIDALNTYTGAVILITHDRHLLRHVADRLWVIKNKTLNQFDGDLQDYIKQIER
ncbi:MAG: glycosyl transferase family 1 [Candidatus Puniceispirillum sp.]|nr:glycosyl transferase family 1 [Candidatus Pelagibacter sp.]MBA4282680.1 glycosyl transferase family 1 [Candidatus Puniceispirillum sp.]